MTASLRNPLSALLPLLLAVSPVAAQASDYAMFRDPNCGCCLKWAEHLRARLDAAIGVTGTQDMQAVKDRYGVPVELRSCHTLIVDGYVIEGHVPAADIARLLKERPAGVRGLAVPGMPMGSPGMDMGGRTQPYQVIAFGPNGQRVFASYR